MVALHKCNNIRCLQLSQSASQTKPALVFTTNSRDDQEESGIQTLVIELNEPCKALREPTSRTGGSNENYRQDRTFKHGYANWCPKKWATASKKGRTCYWCPQPKKDGQYNGLYIIHNPSEHDQWQEGKDWYHKGRRGQKYKGNMAEDTNKSLKKLQSI